MTHKRHWFQKIMVGSLSVLFAGCFHSTNPLPQLLCTPNVCSMALKKNATAEISLKLTQFGESKDQRTYNLSISPQVPGLTVNLTPPSLQFEKTSKIQVSSSADIAAGNYKFTLQAVADSDKFVAQLVVDVE